MKSSSSGRRSACLRIILSSLLAVACYSGAQAQNRKSRGPGCGSNTPPSKTKLNSTKALACKLTSKELQQRKSTVIAALKAQVLERKELPDGYSYTFKADDARLDQLNEFVKTERACCGFFTFRLTIDSDYALLELTGPDGAKDFVNSEIGL